ncbi:MAG: hypothetical protein ACYCT2_01295 [Thermoplasmataceae archaeon]
MSGFAPVTAVFFVWELLVRAAKVASTQPGKIEADNERVCLTWKN